MGESREVVCVICGKSVSRRKSLAYKEGRACRDHQEVMDAAREAEFSSMNDKALSKLNVISGAALVQALHSVRGVPVEACMALLPEYLTKEERREIRRELKERGVMLSSDEATLAMMATMASFKRNNAGAVPRRGSDVGTSPLFGRKSEKEA